MIQPRTARGFTLVETLVAIAILVIAMAGPFYAVQQALTASYTARDNLVASSLAQDGIEYIRSIRDENYLFNLHGGSRSWLYGLDGTGPGGVTCTGTHYCVVDSLFDTIAACNTQNTCPVVTVITTANQTNPYFFTQSTQSATKPTIYRRSVNITTVNAHEAKVIVTVTWTSHNKVNSVLVTDVLENWL